jgi:glucan phosphoethanolaminetransferase (alkaline phosphatase superfamily)
MIQRIQSLLLFAISILLIVFLFVPIWKKEVKQSGDSVTALNSTDKVILKAFNASYIRIENVKDTTIVEKRLGKANTVYIAAIAILAAMVAFISIFQFKNRLLQIKLGFLNSLLISAVLGSIFAGMNAGNDLLSEAGNEEFLIGFYFPLITLLLNLAANRYIRKDEKLVRSVDRIR